jgi:hypothetical protein
VLTINSRRIRTPVLSQRGYIPESAKEHKSAAGFLITNHAHEHIMALFRAVRKRNVHGEVVRFLDIPGGREIVQEFYAQLRKFNLLEDLHRASIRSVQTIAHSLRRFWQQPSILHDAAKPPGRLGGGGKRHRAAGSDAARDHELLPLPDHQTGQKFPPLSYLHSDAPRRRTPRHSALAGAAPLKRNLEIIEAQKFSNGGFGFPK